MKTKHSTDCAKAWARLDPTCPRCQELAAGAPARKGWGSDRKRDEARRIEEIRAHRCTPETCGPVCTRFDW